MILETERLILRPWKIEDVNDMVECLNNHNTTKWLEMPYPYTTKDAYNFILGCQRLL